MALLLLESDVRRLLTMDEALTAVEEAFRSVAHSEAVVMPRRRGALPGVTLSIVGAISQALDLACVKSYPIVRQDVTVGSTFTMLLYQISSGRLVAIVEAGELGQIRTGAASGVAAKYLARAESRVMALFGAGYEAESQLDALSRVLPKLERVYVIGRSRERAQRFCQAMRERYQLELILIDDRERAVGEADIITTATGSSTPVFEGGWLKAGVHINAIGSNFATKQEIDAAAVERADRIVVDDIPTARQESGDLLGAEAQGSFDWSAVQPLSHVVAGFVPGRTSPQEITLFESQGLGLEDLAAASRVLELARERGIGVEIPIR